RTGRDHCGCLAVPGFAAPGRRLARGGANGLGAGAHPRNNGGMDASAVIAALALTPHPEGGHYRETWADSAGTAIYFLLEDGEQPPGPRGHGRPEIWPFYAGAPLELRVDARGPGGAETTTTRLGSSLLVGEHPQAVVPAGAWQRARSLGAWSLVGCTVAPP